MRRIELMTAGGVTLAGLGVVAGLAIGSGDGGQKLLAQRQPAVEVRTETVRRTVNVYRREHPHHVAGSGHGGGPSGTAGALGGRGAATRTRASGVHSTGAPSSAAPVVTTRTSGTHASSGGGSGSSEAARPVATRTSGGGAGGGGSSRRVSTRTSGGGEHDGGGHDD